MRVFVLLILQLYFAEGFLPRPPQVYLPADDGDDPGVPLILTPYIKRGEIELARNLSQVSLPGTWSLNVPSHAGFLTVNATYNSNLFFWYIPNQIDTYAEQCVVLWLQGGPGASSLYGLFEENGPIQVQYTNETYSFVFRELHWSLFCGLLYIDNPVGAGFSFTEDQRGFCKNQIQVGEQLYSALIQFSQLFPESQASRFVIAGESYAGKYIPALGHTIHEKNPSAEIKINLHGMLILNGWCDPINQLLYHKHGHQLGFYDELSALQIKAMEWKTSHHIENNNWLRASEVNQIMFKYIENAILPGHEQGHMGHFNLFNLLNDTEDPHYFINYINTNKIRKAIHAGSVPYNPVSQTVYQHLKPDIFKSVSPWISELLEHYKMGFNNGQLDLVVPYASTVNFLEKLDFPDREFYRAAERHVTPGLAIITNNYSVSIHTTGYSKQAGNLQEGARGMAGHQIAKEDGYALELMLGIIDWPGL